jgi:hypothetical protein
MACKRQVTNFIKLISKSEPSKRPSPSHYGPIGLLSMLFTSIPRPFKGPLKVLKGFAKAPPKAMSTRLKTYPI